MVISIELARTFYDDSDPVHDFDHVLRVLALARRIGSAEGANMSVVETAVLLHDINRVRDATEPMSFIDSTDHGVVAAAFARDLLSKLDPPGGAAFIDAVAHAIEAHRFRNAIEPETLEAKVVFDADKLDAIGAVGVARAYAYGARLGKKLWADVPGDYAGGDPDHTPVHEFNMKLVHIRDRMQTETGRAIAQARHTYMVAFFERLAQEVRGEA